MLVKKTTLLAIASLNLAYLTISADPAFSFSFGKKIIAPDGAANDRFGRSVGISGNTVIVGSPFDDDNGNRSGSAYLFDVTTGSLLHKLTAFDGEAKEFFGLSVAISGNTAIVSSSNNSAYLFDVTTGNLLTKLTAPDGSNEFRFGFGVAINDNTAIVAQTRNDNGDTFATSAYSFDTTTGNLLAELTAFDVTGSGSDLFGRSLGVSGNTAIVGWESDDDNGDDSGSAYLFDVTTGSLLHKLTAFDGARGDGFGHSVGISGNTAIVGSESDDDNELFNSGSAYLFDATTGNLLTKLTAPDPAFGDRFGHSVGISDNTAIVGAFNDSTAYLFDVTTGNLLTELTAFDGTKKTKTGFSKSVGISGNNVIVGAPSDNDNGSSSGAVYIYTREAEKVPEPITILGTLTALGLGTAVKQKHSHKN